MPPESLAQLKELSQFLDETANIRPNPRLPWVGAAAFSHKGGTHVNAVQKVIRSYEHIDPALVGNARHVLISDLAGRSNIVMKARELGFDVTNSTPELREMLDADQGARAPGLRVRSGRRLAGAAHPPGARPRDPPPFVVDAYHVSMRREADDARSAKRPSRCGSARSSAHTVAEGDGPVNALDAALRAALVRFYRQLEQVRLTDYKVRIIDSTSGTAARTRVLIESSDGTSEWGTVGVNDNIVEASLQALVDSLEYALVKDTPVALSASVTGVK